MNKIQTYKNQVTCISKPFLEEWDNLKTIIFQKSYYELGSLNMLFKKNYIIIFITMGKRKTIVIFLHHSSTLILIICLLLP